MANWGDSFCDRFLHFFIVDLSCEISLPQHADDACQQVRIGEINQLKRFFKTKQLKSSTIAGQGLSGLSLPGLDQTWINTRNYYMADKFSAHWFNLYFLMMAKTVKEVLQPLATTAFSGKDFRENKDYLDVPAFFKKKIKVIQYINFKYRAILSLHNVDKTSWKLL